MALKYNRKLDEAWVFDDLFVQDGAGNRQTILGVTDLTARLRSIDGLSVITTNDAAGCSIDETSDPSTVGNFSYRRTDLSAIVAGTSYYLDFYATINGVRRAIPEEDYIVVAALA